jgi:hypothetical protein
MKYPQCRCYANHALILMLFSQGAGKRSKEKVPDTGYLKTLYTEKKTQAALSLTHALQVDHGNSGYTGIS